MIDFLKLAEPVELFIDNSSNNTFLIFDLVGEPTSGMFSGTYSDPKIETPTGFGGAILIRNPSNKNEEILQWISGYEPIRSNRGEIEGQGVKPDIEVNFLQKAKEIKFNENIYQMTGKKLIESAKCDPQLEEARRLLSLPKAEFQKLSNGYHSGGKIIPKL